MAVTNDENDCYEQPAAGRKLHHCSKCQHVGPLSDFTYRRSRLADENEGFANNVWVTHEGRICRKCRLKTQKRKPVIKLNARELHNRVMSGEMRQRIADAYVERRAEKALRAQTQAVEQRWARERKTAWFAALLPELRAIVQARKFCLHREVTRAQPGLDARLAFYDAYKALLRACRARLLLRFIRPGSSERRMPQDGESWQDHVSEAERDRMAQLWEAIPLVVRARLRIPVLVNAAQAPVRRRNRTWRGQPVTPRTSQNLCTQDNALPACDPGHKLAA